MHRGSKQAAPTPTRLEVPLSTSPLDKKAYRLIRLFNGIECLLVSTGERDRADSTRRHGLSLYSLPDRHDETRVRGISVMSNDGTNPTTVGGVNTRIRAFSDERLVSTTSHTSHASLRVTQYNGLTTSTAAVPAAAAATTTTTTMTTTPTNSPSHIGKNEENNRSRGDTKTSDDARGSHIETQNSTHSLDGTRRQITTELSAHLLTTGVVASAAGRRISAIVLEAPLLEPATSDTATASMMFVKPRRTSSILLDAGPGHYPSTVHVGRVEQILEEENAIASVLSRPLASLSGEGDPIGRPQSRTQSGMGEPIQPNGGGDDGASGSEPTAATTAGGASQVAESSTPLNSHRRAHRLSYLNTSSSRSGRRTTGPMVSPMASMTGSFINESETMAAVAMAIGVGSFAAPRGLDGLAHYLEHCLFMGSVDYPEENAFDKVLAKAGGSSNAYTDTERTVYHFTCLDKDLADIMPIFSQFFVAPLLDPTRNERELASIDSEFVLRQNIDGCRLQEVWRETSRENTPFATFTCGNTKTLRDLPRQRNVDVNAALFKFHSEWYVGENMRLVVVSSESLNALEDMVKEAFYNVTSIPTFTPFTVKEAGFPWEVKQGVGCVFRMIPTHEKHELFLTWQLKPELAHYKHKATEYIAHLLGHESQGSVLAAAKAYGWATAISVGTTPDDGFFSNTGCTLFNATLSLTIAGLNNWVFVAGLVFEYIGILRARFNNESSFENPDWIYSELESVRAMQFQFQEEPDPRWLAQSTCVNMLPQSGMALSDLLEGSSKFYTWNPQAIRDVLAAMHPSMVRIDLLSSRLNTPNNLTTPEPLRKSRNVPDIITHKGGGGGGGGGGVVKTVDGIIGSKEGQVVTPTTPRGGGGSFVGSGFVDGNASDTPARNEDLASIVSCRRPNRPPTVEKFAGAQYWSDTIPSDIMTTWDHLYMGKDTVGTSVAGKESFLRSLALPPPNPFISTNFDRCPHPAHALQNKLMGVKLMLRTSTRKGNWTEYFGGKVVGFDKENGLLLVEYQQGSRIRRWFFVGTHGEDAPPSLIPTTTTANVNNDGSTTSGGPVSPTQPGEMGSVGILDEKATPHLTKSRPGSWYANLTTRRTSHRKSATSASRGSVSSLVGGTSKAPSKDVIVLDDGKSEAKLWNEPPFTQRSGSMVSSPSTSHRGNDESVTPPPASHVDATSIKSMESATETLTRHGSQREMEEQLDAFPTNTDHTPRSIFWKKFPTPPKVSPFSLPALLPGSDDLLSCWFLQDTVFGTPKVEVYICFVSPLLGNSAFNSALGDLFAVLVFESLNQESYLAYLSELDFEIEVSGGIGIQLRFSGFSHKIPELVAVVMRRLLFFTSKDALQKHMETPPPTTTGHTTSSTKKTILDLDTPIFHARLEALLSDYLNASSRFRSSAQVSSVMFELLCGDKLHSMDDKEKHARKITPEALLDFASKVFVECTVEMFAYGNIGYKESKALFDTVNSELRRAGTKPLPMMRAPRLKATELAVAAKNAPVSGLVRILEAIESPSHSVELFFQLPGQDTLEKRVMLSAVEHLMREPMYAELRSTQQLGYSVKCGARSVCGSLGFVVEITSDKHGPEVLAQDVDQFFVSFRDNVANKMTAGDFITNMCALGAQILQKPQNLPEAAATVWSTIATHIFYGSDYAFDAHVEEAKFLRDNMSITKFLDFFDMWLHPASMQRRRASVYVVGRGYHPERLIAMLMAEENLVRVYTSSTQQTTGGRKGGGISTRGRGGGGNSTSAGGGGKKLCIVM